MNYYSDIFLTWKRSKKEIDFEKREIWNFRVCFNVLQYLGSSESPYSLNEKQNIVNFYQVKEWINGEPIFMTHGSFRGIVVNLSLNPPRIVIGNEVIIEENN